MKKTFFSCQTQLKPVLPALTPKYVQVFRIVCSTHGQRFGPFKKTAVWLFPLHPSSVWFLCQGKEQVHPEVTILKWFNCQTPHRSTSAWHPFFPPFLVMFFKNNWLVQIVRLILSQWGRAKLPTKSGHGCHLGHVSLLPDFWELTPFWSVQFTLLWHFSRRGGTFLCNPENISFFLFLREKFYFGLTILDFTDP